MIQVRQVRGTVISFIITYEDRMKKSFIPFKNTDSFINKFTYCTYLLTYDSKLFLKVSTYLRTYVFTTNMSVNQQIIKVYDREFEKSHFTVEHPVSKNGENFCPYHWSHS